MMRWFWYSLIVFCLLMCSCRSKKVVSDVQLDTKRVSEIAYLNENVRIDTTRTAYTEQLEQIKRIVETLIITEYDKENGNPVKETYAKRETIQDSDKVVSTEEVKGTSEVNNDSLNHSREVTKKMESDTESVSENSGLASVWEKFGEVMGVGTLILIAYLCWKLKRVN